MATMNNTSHLIHNTSAQLKLSFIIPVYNVAPYLKKCVNSLIHQDFRDYEIILIDDGSTDGSGKICDELSATISEDRLAIIVIHQANAGLSAARNAGLKVAKGEYVCFVDSDDYWEENVLGGLMEQVVRDELDVLRFDYQNVNEHYEVFEPNKTPRYIDKKDDVVDGVTYLNTRMGYACYAVMYIMRKAIVPTFTEGVHFEDVDWLPRMMLRAKRVNCTTTIVYNYIVRQGSITKVQGDKKKIRKNIEDMMTIISKYNDYNAVYPNCLWLREMCSSMVVSVLANVAQYLYQERKVFLCRLKSFGVYPLTMETKQGSTYMRKARLINFSPRLTVELLHIKNG